MRNDILQVSVVIPAFNEEAAVGAEVHNIRQALRQSGIPHEIIVVDDGSHDRTAEEAVRAGARVLKHLHNRGYGASLKTGITAAKYEMICITDADGTYPADQIPVLLEKLRTADMAVGARIGANVNIPLVRKPAKMMLRWLAERVAGRKIPDLNSGLRVFRRELAMQYFPILSNQFSFTTTITLALMADDYLVAYHPIDYYARVGRSKIVPRHFMDFMVLVLRMAMLFQPLKVFIPVGLTFGALGVLKVVFDVATSPLRHPGNDWSVFYTPVLSTSAILLLLIGLQFLLIGMVADGVVRRIALRSGPMAVSRAVVAAEITKQSEEELEFVER
ncbi:MAG: glycosyltransferase family 2 protein [Acidobacteria bacterium]|nr:glycosyltransferase family 2 protein [Acidobacteriota bacterium]